MDIIGITIWREARSEGELGMRAVLHVILNRALPNPATPWPDDPERVCLQPYQFSCWNNGDRQRSLYPRMDDLQYSLACQLVAYSGDDPTGGAVFYYDISIAAPTWSRTRTFTVQIGRLKFYT